MRPTRIVHEESIICLSIILIQTAWPVQKDDSQTAGLMGRLLVTEFVGLSGAIASLKCYCNIRNSVQVRSQRSRIGLLVFVSALS